MTNSRKPKKDRLESTKTGNMIVRNIMTPHLRDGVELMKPADATDA